MSVVYVSAGDHIEFCDICCHCRPFWCPWSVLSPCWCLQSMLLPEVMMRLCCCWLSWERNLVLKWSLLQILIENERHWSLLQQLPSPLQKRNSLDRKSVRKVLKSCDKDGVVLHSWWLLAGTRGGYVLNYI